MLQPWWLNIHFKDKNITSWIKIRARYVNIDGSAAMCFILVRARAHQVIIQLAQAMLNVAAEASGHGAGSVSLGFIVVVIIEAPVLILLLATFLGKPRQPKITGIFVSFIAMMVILFISAVFGLSYILGIFY
jgi:hypothetical protein